MVELRDAINAVKNLQLHDALHRRSEDVIAELNAVDADVKAIETHEEVEDEFVTYKVTTNASSRHSEACAVYLFKLVT